MSLPTPFQSIQPGASAVSNGAAYSPGFNCGVWSLVVVASAGVTGGQVGIQLSHNGSDWWTPPANSYGPITLTGPGVYAVSVGLTAALFARAQIQNAITGGTIGASIAAV